MINFVRLSFLSVIALLATAVPAMAQEATEAARMPVDLTYLGIGLVVIGAGYGIGKLAASALESMARQPEVAGNIQTAMIIAAALIEGFTFFALLLCWIA